MKTDGQKCIKESKDAFLYLLIPKSPTQRQDEYIILVFDVTERQNDCYVECVTVEHVEFTDSVQCATELY